MKLISLTRVLASSRVSLPSSVKYEELWLFIEGVFVSQETPSIFV